MATAAPAAPSPSAPASAQPAPGTGNAEAAPDTVTIPAAPDSTPRLARPLRPIPSLPGVFPDDDPFPVGASKSAAATDPANPSSPGATTTAARGPDGRFVAGASPAATDGGEPALEVGTQDQQPATPKFKFGGEEFDSREAAEQNFKSLRGQYRPLQALARSLGGIDKIQTTFQQAAESARGWKAEAERLSAELQQARAGQPAASPSSSSTTTAVPDATDAKPADVDWELYAEIKKLANESGEPWKAEQWLINEVRKADRAHYESILDERFAPIAEAEQQAAVVSQTETLFSNLAEYVNADGSVAYPELHDEAASYAIGRMWASLGLPPEAALTPQGAIAAIAIYRMAKGAGGSQAGSVADAQPMTLTPPTAPTDAHAAAALGGDGRNMDMRIPDGMAGSASAEAARVLAGLRQANRGNRAVLGFEP
jgi:hypothetical protein